MIMIDIRQCLPSVSGRGYLLREPTHAGERIPAWALLPFQVMTTLRAGLLRDGRARAPSRQRKGTRVKSGKQ
jgi:hypothetical protein